MFGSGNKAYYPVVTITGFIIGAQYKCVTRQVTIILCASFRKLSFCKRLTDSSVIPIYCADSDIICKFATTVHCVNSFVIIMNIIKFAGPLMY